ncbi:MAG: hypothetical protein IT535_06715 [Bauldia sp.]|nr:hypothetical protein [Bauldia sp.]
MRIVCLLFGLVSLFAPAALAAPEDDLRTLREEAMARPGVLVTEYPDFTMVEDRAHLTIFYFTKPSHYAHPAAVQRAVVQENGAFSMNYTVWPHETPQSAPASFQRWMAEFAELDRRMREAIQRDLAPR